MANGRQGHAIEAKSSEPFCLVLRLLDSVELLEDEYRYFFCEYGSVDARDSS